MKPVLIPALCLLLLSACGGGGGSNDSVPAQSSSIAPPTAVDAAPQQPASNATLPADLLPPS